jgi:hypothetical protein
VVTVQVVQPKHLFVLVMAFSIIFLKVVAEAEAVL